MKKLLLISVLLTGTSAAAHDAPMGWKYDAWCCQGPSNGETGDCAQIRTSSVRVVNGGYDITLNVGDHPKVTKAQVFRVEQGHARRSKDEFYHICLFPTEDKLRCLFAPTMGF